MGRKRLMEARLAASMSKKDEAPGVSTKKSGGGIIDPGKKSSIAQKPRTAVSKLKEDVRSLKKLLRSRSTPSGKACLSTSEEQVEMKSMPLNSELEQQPGLDHSRAVPGVRKASLKTLMKRIHFRGDSESPQGMKGIANRFSSIKSKQKDSERTISMRTDSSASAQTSTESSDSTAHLNKALPLLQRIRLLGEREKTAGLKSTILTSTNVQSSAANSNSGSPSTSANESAAQEVIGEGLPLLERLKLLRAKEQAEAANLTASNQVTAKDQSIGVLKSKIAKNHQNEPSKTSVLPSTKKSPSLSTRINSAMISKTSNIANTNLSTRGAAPLNPSQVKGRTSESSSELPLLKKVLLMKMMEDKRPTANEQAESSMNFPQKKYHDPVSRDNDVSPIFNEQPNTNTPTLISKMDTMVESKRTMIRPESKHVISTVASQMDGHYKPMMTTSALSSSSSSTFVTDSKPAKRTSVSLQSDQRGHRVNISQQVPIECHTVPNTRPDNVLNAGNSVTYSGSSNDNVSPNVGAVNSITIKSNNPQPQKSTPSSDEGKNTDNEEEFIGPKTRVRKDSTTAQLLRSNTDEGYAARKGKLSRMVALREDSDEHGSDNSSSNSGEDENLSSCSDDPFVKNIECQTEVNRSTSTSPDTWSSQEIQRNRLKLDDIANPTFKRQSKPLTTGTKNQEKKKKLTVLNPQDDSLHLSDDGIQDYLVKVMKNVKQAIKSYVLDHQQELQDRVLSLEKQVKEKEAKIRKLKATLYAQSRDSTTNRTSSTFDDVSSLDLSCLSSTDSENENVFLQPDQHSKRSRTKGNSTNEGQEEEDNEIDDDIQDSEDDEHLLKMQRSLSQRKSWTYGGSNEDLASRIKQRRRKLLSSRQSYSLDDEKSQVTVAKSKAGELWKLEFPFSKSRLSSTSSYCTTIAEPPDGDSSEQEENFPDELETDVVEERVSPVEDLILDEQFEISPNIGSESGGNDWEVQMLVQQFEKNIRQQKRRHSSGEVLSWQSVLGSRLGQAPFVTDQPTENNDIRQKPYAGHGRKFSLVEGNLSKQWGTLQKSAPKQRSMWHLSNIVANPSNHPVVGSESKLSQGENTDTFHKFTSSNPQNKSSALDKKTSTRRRAYRHRRQNSFNEIKTPQHPRKSSLPSVDSLRNLSVSRWSSIENTNLGSSRPSSNSSSQRDNVVNVDSRFGSLDDVSRAVARRRHPWPRSPSSPNFTTADQQFSDFPSASEQCIPEWPSSPCLPTITEDDPSAVPSLTSSPCRSFSHDCIPALPTSPLWSTAVSSSNPWTHHSKESSSLSSFKQNAPVEMQKLDVKASSDTKFVKLREAKDLDDSRLIPFAQSREDSVVIAIPECEPLLSPR